VNDHSSLPPNQIRFLEQLSDREFWDYAQSLATQQYAPSITDEQVLECQTEQDRYLFPLRALREVVAPPHELAHLPLSPAWMSGITAWRGHVIPVVDLASYFIAHKMNELDATRHVCSPSNSMLLILDDTNVLLGLQIAFVGSIRALKQAQLAQPEVAPLWYPQCLLAMILGVYDGSVLLNPQMLIDQILNQIKVSNVYE
jgi:chemotaxis signal transduction protein